MGELEMALADARAERDQALLRISAALDWCYSHDKPDALPGSIEDHILTEVTSLALILTGKPRMQAAGPIKQTIVEGANANCLQAAVASILGLTMDQVPNFALFRANWFDALLSWCEQNAWDIAPVMPMHVPGEKVLAFGQSPRGNRHAVVWQADRMAHDPHPDGGGLVEAEEFWMIGPDEWPKEMGA
jgi:hypothetical protein